MSIFQTLSKATEKIVSVGNRAIQTASRPGAAATTETPAATYEASTRCPVADQQRALKKFGIPPASSGWQNTTSDVKFSGQTATLGKPENWGQIKQDLVLYLDGAQHHRGRGQFANKSQGFVHLERSSDNEATLSIGEYLAPGSVSVSIHGLRPVDVDKNGQKRASEVRNRTPFDDGGWPYSLRSSEEVAAKILPNLKDDDKAPIFLNSCNAGTESQGVVPAADIARLTGRYVVAPVDSKILATSRGPQLNDDGGEWRAFHPDGTSELLYKPKSYPNSNQH